MISWNDLFLTRFLNLADFQNFLFVKFQDITQFRISTDLDLGFYKSHAIITSFNQNIR